MNWRTNGSGNPVSFQKELPAKPKHPTMQGSVFRGWLYTSCPEAFKQSTLQAAREKWYGFAANNQLPAGFTCENEGREKAVLKYHGCAIHADYDLMALCNTGQDGEIGFTSEEDQKELFPKVERLLNMRFNTKMIQHVSEVMYKEGVGERKTEQVYFFGPKRRFKLSYSSMPKKAMAH